MRVSIILLVSLLASAGMVRGATAVVNELTHAEVVMQDMSSKLNRGIANILTGWCEIPRQMIISGKDKGGWAVIPVGIPAGALMTLVRTGVGVFETGLFFIPINESYGPILDPAFVWQKSKL